MSEIDPERLFVAAVGVVPADEAPWSSDRSHESAVVARLRAELQLKEAQLAHSQKIFAKSSMAAKIGVWECSLPDETLQWTDMVYDLFDLPRGSPLVRSEIVQCYTQEAAGELEIRRNRAIEERSGFEMDAEITTAKGHRRWIRLTATVECEDSEPVRIFGMKQDITEQKILFNRTRYLAEYDPMTGLANRSQFQARLSELCDRGHGALLLIDLDWFKKINDTLGHAAGDECLKEMATRLMDVCREAVVVARIGGDEFAVLLGPHFDRGSIADFAQEIVDALGQPVHQSVQPIKLGASVGIAFVDGSTPSELFRTADAALYAAKADGRSAYRIFESGTGLRRA